MEREFTSDSFHENGENIYLMTYTLEGDKGVGVWANSPEPLGLVLKRDFSQVKLLMRNTKKK